MKVAASVIIEERKCVIAFMTSSSLLRIIYCPEDNYKKLNLAMNERINFLKIGKLIVTLV